MSAMNDASDNNGSEGQADGVAYATFGANAGVDQVIVMAKTRVIMAYADPKEMLAGTNVVLSRCGPGLGPGRSQHPWDGAAHGRRFPRISFRYFAVQTPTSCDSQVFDGYLR
jgi:hypothetical protein